MFELEFPFEMRILNQGLGSVVVGTGVDDEILRMGDALRGPYLALTEASGMIDIPQERLVDVIEASPRWEFLDNERKYFWKRPRLPPENFHRMGNSILTCMCRVFSVSRAVNSSELTQSIVRDRILRQDGPISDVPVGVLEGIAERSGLYHVENGHICRKEGIEWCTVSPRDVVLLKACIEFGRVVSSSELHLWLVRSGLSQENSSVTIAYSPFLVHSRSGVGRKEGIYRFIVDRKDLDFSRFEDENRELNDAQALSHWGESIKDELGEGYEVRVRIPVSSRTTIFGTSFCPDACGLEGEWSVVDRRGVCVGTIMISGQSVSGLSSVIDALGLGKGDVLELLLYREGQLVVAL